MALRLITAPVEEPVTLGQAKDALRYSDTLFDAPLRQALVAARMSLDGANGFLGRAVMPQEWELTLPGFPGGGFFLPLPPLLAVVSVGYRDDDGVTTPLDAGSYEITPGGDDRSWIAPTYNTAWPGSVRTGPGAVAVRFRCGWASAAEVPELIRMWIISQAGAFMAQPEALSMGVQPMMVPVYRHLLENLRVYA